MVCDHGHDALSGPVYFPLGKAEELDVVVLEPFEGSFLERLSV